MNLFLKMTLPILATLYITASFVQEAATQDGVVSFPGSSLCARLVYDFFRFLRRHRGVWFFRKTFSDSFNFKLPELMDIGMG